MRSSTGFRELHHLAVGSPLRLETPAGVRRADGARDLHAAAGGGPARHVSISSRTFDSLDTTRRTSSRSSTTRGGVSAANTAALNVVLRRSPTRRSRPSSQFIKNQEAGLNSILNLLYVLLGLSIIVSLFGIVNTLVLTVFERTRELGMLRAVGMTRRQARRMIRHEAVVTALIGAALGIPLGIGLAALFGHALERHPLRLPWTTIVVFVVAAIVVGLLAAIFPARRASRLNVLKRCSTSSAPGGPGQSGPAQTRPNAVVASVCWVANTGLRPTKRKVISAPFFQSSISLPFSAE